MPKEHCAHEGTATPAATADETEVFARHVVERLDVVGSQQLGVDFHAGWAKLVLRVRDFPHDELTVLTKCVASNYGHLEHRIFGHSVLPSVEVRELGDIDKAKANAVEILVD